MIAKEMILVLDTETCDLSGSVYDVGYTIADKKGNISITRNWLVAEVFTDAKRMMGAYYAKKMFTHYAQMLQNGEVKLTPWADIVETMRADCATYKVTTAAAYHAGFDFRVMAATHEMLGNSGKILPKGLKILDLWQFACETKLSQKAYKKMARENNWVSPAGNIKTGAEFAYRYTTQRPEFIEDHTALSDALIETQIMAACFAQKKRVPYGITNAQPWRIVNAKPVENDPHIHGARVA
jgi:hypothetical protein